MRRGEQTREHIIEQAAGLFNRMGFAGASMSDIMAATGLQKGGIYRHFESKEALAVEAFDFSIRRMAERFTRALEGKEHALDRLHAVIDVYARIPVDPPVPGGCPILSTAVENDHGNPVLRDRVREAVDGLRTLIRQTVRKGIARGEVGKEVDADDVAGVIVATLEGGVMLAQLYDDGTHMERATRHLKEYLDERVRA